MTVFRSTMARTDSFSNCSHWWISGRSDLCYAVFGVTARYRCPRLWIVVQRVSPPWLGSVILVWIVPGISRYPWYYLPYLSKLL